MRFMITLMIWWVVVFTIASLIHWGLTYSINPGFGAIGASVITLSFWVGKYLDKSTGDKFF